MDLTNTLIFIFGLVLILSSWTYAYFKTSNSSVSFSSFKPCEIPDLSFRFYKEEDKTSCVEIYQEIESRNQIPSGMLDEFVDYLESKDDGQKIFVILSKEKVIATCGVKNMDTAIFLLYGLVKPEYQRKGLGAVLLSLRAQELSGDNQMIALSPTDYSEPYYKRFGFITFYNVGDECFVEGDERLLKHSEEFKKTMFLSVDMQGGIFMRGFLERVFHKQLLKSEL